MNRRIQNKQAKRFGQRVSDAFSLYMVLGLAKPSFYALSEGARRVALYDALRQPWGLRVSHRCAKRISRRWQVLTAPDPQGERK